MSETPVYVPDQTPIRSRRYYRKVMRICCITGLLIGVFAWFTGSLYGTIAFPAMGIWVFIVSCTLRGELVLLTGGIHAVHPNGTDLVVIPWNKIRYCKVFESTSDDPDICVFFQNDAYYLHNKLLRRAERINYRSSGRIVLCEYDLRSLVFGRMTPEKFASRPIFGCIIKREEYYRVLAWRKAYAAAHPQD